MNTDHQLKEAIEAFRALPPDVQERLLAEQRRSWVRGEVALGSDRDEAAYRKALAAGDQATLQRLKDEAAKRLKNFDKRWPR